MTETTTLTGATLPDGRVRNVVLRHGSVSHIRPVGIPDPGQTVVDLTGYLLLPAPVEPHVHLDRALTWEPVGSDPDGRDGAVRSWRAWSARYTTNDLRRRARTALMTLSGNGATAVRTHIDIGVGAGAPLRAVEILRELREDLHRVLDLQIVAVPSPGLSDRAALEAFSAGAGLLGGRPHSAPDPRRETRRLLRLADRAEVDLDLHLDDQPDSRVLAVADLARLLRASGFGRQVTASHCALLGRLRPPALAKVVEAIAASGMAVVGLPSAPPARRPGADPGTATAPCGGATAVQALLDAGVPLAAGGDHLRDALHPMGRADALETAALLAATCRLTPDQAYAAVSVDARDTMRLPQAGPEPGAVADLLAVRAGSLAEALASPPVERIVFRRGRVISRTNAPALAPPARGRLTITPQRTRVPAGAR
ncbi:amidohydrolase family protein [Yinghuangia seranimata]|uniref:amidohydrolase family protein n=1 Tax=Yinghuangia seranimata TaxID=408067 RepID=UPI00248CEAA2|nr:amidohydrolase family protein [Yinghuangia seranimata]MDI2132011.1 amidohydrolase family protein [Yinghuangia seranimata]